VTKLYQEKDSSVTEWHISDGLLDLIMLVINRKNDQNQRW
jgi:hypothetical protein